MVNEAPSISRENNLDLVRIVAAYQVVLVHATHHLDAGFDKTNGYLFAWIQSFPGVPIFFFVSGFLISGAYERSPSFGFYLKRRSARIFPGLWGCVLLSMFTLSIVLTDAMRDEGVLAISVWSLCQATIFQIYNPDFFREFGTGVWNGSLWTISVEIQFYLVMPMIAKFAFSKSTQSRFLRLVLLFGSSAILSLTLQHSEVLEVGSLQSKLLRYSSIPYIWMFIGGILGRDIFVKYRSVFIGRIWFWIAAFFLLFAALQGFGFSTGGNLPHPFAFIVLSGLVLALAFNSVGLAKKVLEGKDISYGVYLYHMPVVNVVLLVTDLRGITAVILVFLISTMLGLVSWTLIEKPAIGSIVRPA